MTPDELVKLLEALSQRVEDAAILLAKGEELRGVYHNASGGEDPRDRFDALLAEGFQAIGLIGFWKLGDLDKVVCNVSSLPGVDADAWIRDHLERVISFVTEMYKSAGGTTQRVDPGWN